MELRQHPGKKRTIIVGAKGFAGSDMGVPAVSWDLNDWGIR